MAKLCVTIISLRRSNRSGSPYQTWGLALAPAAAIGSLPLLVVMVPVLVANNEELQPLRPDERQVAELINGRWDVSAILLASQQRELDALRTLFKLRRLGLLKTIDEIGEDTLLE